MIYIRNCLILLFGLYFSLNLSAQGLTKEEIRQYYNETPSFSIYKDNYFIGGIPLNTDIDKTTADVKYQISMKQMVTKNILPWNTYLYVTYSQKSFWNVIEESSPFEEINFNPSIGFGKPILNKNNRLVGIATLAFNHNSNGRAGEDSRSWNSINLSYSTLINEKTTLSVEAWIPFLYHESNPDILDYEGLFKFKINRELIADKLNAEIQVKKGLTWGWEGSLRMRFYYSPFEANNQYLMLEWYMGYAENLVYYDKFRNMIRLGYVIKINELDILKKKSKLD